MNSEPTDYTNSGFDSFLSRGDSPNLSGNLDNENVQNNAVAFDRTQTSGSLGDTYTVGNIHIDGSGNEIYSLDSNNNKRISLGTQANGAEALLISREGTNANINRPQDLLFNSTLNLFQVSISGSYTFSSVLGLANNVNQVQSFSIAHGVSGIPSYLVYAQTQKPALEAIPFHQGFPFLFYVQVAGSFSFTDSANLNNIILVGIDNTNLYVNRYVVNQSGSTADSPAISINYFVNQQSITS